MIPVLETERTFPYVYHNGQVNLVLPKRFSQQPKCAKRTASELAVEGQFLRKHPENGQKRNLVIVSGQSDSDPDHEVEAEVQRVFDELEMDFVPRDGIDEFIAKVDSEAN